MKLGKLGVTLFVSGMSVLLFASFLFGVLVGEHLDAYPERYSGGLADLVRDRFSGLAIAPKQLDRPLADETASDADIAPEKEELGLTFYKVLGENNDRKPEDKDRGARGNDNRIAPAAGSVSGGLPAAGTVLSAPFSDKDALKESSSGSFPLKSKDNKGTVGSSEKMQDKEKYPEQFTGQGDSGIDNKVRKDGFQVQAAAYTDVHQAEKMVKRLKNMGFSPTIQPREIPGKGKWFRVIVGEFEDRSKAELAVGKINKKIKGVKCVIRRNKGGKT